MTHPSSGRSTHTTWAAWRRWRAAEVLGAARAAAADHLFRRGLEMRLPLCLRQWRLAASRAHAIAIGLRTEWPGVCSEHCEGLRARWGAWVRAAHVLGSRREVMRSVAWLGDTYRMALATKRWRSDVALEQASRRLEAAVDGATVATLALRRWRRRCGLRGCSRCVHVATPLHLGDGTAARVASAAFGRWLGEAKVRSSLLALSTVWDCFLVSLAFGRWRGVAKVRSSLLALSTALTWRYATRQRQRGWIQWVEWAEREWPVDVLRRLHGSGWRQWRQWQRGWRQWREKSRTASRRSFPLAADRPLYSEL